MGEAMFSDAFGTPLPDLQNLPESFAPVGALLESLDEQSQHTQTVVAGSHAHFNMLAVLPDRASSDVALNLVKICIQNAANCGYRFAITAAHGPVSLDIFRTPGFHMRFTFPYKDFLFEGKPVFASIESTVGIMLMEMSL